MIALLRILLVIAALVCLSLTLYISVISVQAGDPLRSSRILSLDQDCLLPCWEYVQPGKTSANEAIAILSQRPWASAVRRVNEGIIVEWNHSAPAWVDPLSAGTVRVRGDTVGPILLKSSLRVGDFYYMYGLPELVDTSVSGRIAQILLYYPESKMGLAISLPCPVTRLDLWTARPVIRLDSRLLYSGDPSLRNWQSTMPFC